MLRISFPFLLLFAVSFSGCASLGTYLKDRGLDFVDIWSARVGYGGPVCARVKVGGVFYVAAGISWEWRYGFAGRNLVYEESFTAGVPVVNLGGLLFLTNPARVGPEFAWLFETRWFCSMLAWSPICTGLEKGKFRSFEEKEFSEYAYMAFIGIQLAGFQHEDYDRYFDLGVGACAGAAFEFGFSFVEFADFLTGWFGVDFKDDDEATEKARKKRYEQTLERLLDEFKKEQDPKRREEMLYENTWERRRKPVKILIYALLNDPEPDVRCEAALYLGRIGDKKAVEPLKQAYFKDKNGNVRWAASEALSKFRIDPERMDKESESEEEKPPVEKGDKETS